MKPFLDKKMCCANPDICTIIKACPAEAISYVKDEQEPLGGKIEFDYEKCTECESCVDVCSGHAVATK